MNKNANFQDIGSWIQFVIGFIIVCGIVLTFVGGFNNQVQNQNETSVPSETKIVSQTYASRLPLLMDFFFLSIFIVFFGFSVMSARLIPSTPKFIMISIAIIISAPFLGMLIENFWEGWSTAPALATAMQSMIFFPFIMDYLRYFLLLYSVTIAIALLSKENA